MSITRERNPEVVLTAGTSNLELAKEVSEHLKINMVPTEIKQFADGESYVFFMNSFRGDNVYIIQSTCKPVNDNLIQLLLMIDAARRASARKVNVILPYYGYARQDRKDKPRVPISAKLVANIIAKAGADRVVVVDLHVEQIQGFFDIPFDHLYARKILRDYFKNKFKNEIKNGKVVMVSPDAGGVDRVRKFASELELPIAIIDKRRPEQNKSEVMNVIGKVNNKIAIILDDLIDTAGTITKAAEALLGKGAVEVYAACTHPVFSGPAVTRLKNSVIKEIVVTNTIPLSQEGRKVKKIKVLSVGKLIADAIRCIQTGNSMNLLFK